MAVSETIVREFFELRGFLVHQRRKYVSTQARDEDEIDFYVLNPNPEHPGTPLPFVLTAPAIRQIERAIVVVKGWHTETFSSGVLANNPAIFRFVEPAVLRQASRFFGTDTPLTKLLIVPALPQPAEGRDQSIAFLRSKGVDAVMLFDTLLADLVQEVEPNRNYEKSELLQILRVLKSYRFLKDPQMELFQPSPQKGAPRRTTACPTSTPEAESLPPPA